MYTRLIKFQETDAAGVVYFANVLSICHEAYEASLFEAGVNLQAFFKGVPLAYPILQAEVDFKQPLFCGDRIVVQLAPRLLKPSQFEITYQVWRTGQDSNSSTSQVLSAIAKTRHICIEVASRQQHPLPPFLQSWLASFVTDSSEPSEPGAID